jgi:uncharacterized protein (UPF0276 family)
MTKIAIADSANARTMLTQGILNVNYLETHGPLVESARSILPDYPMLLHNSIYDWSLSHPKALEQQDVIPRTLDVIAKTRTPWLSVHLGFSSTSVVFKENWMQPLSPTLESNSLLRYICHNFSDFASLVPIPVILENLDYYPNGAYEYVCEPKFITDVLRETNAGMLLDIAHARVSASRFGLSIHEYLKQLPLNRVRQLHISGPRWRNGVLEDDHEVLLEEDYKLLEYVLDSANPLALTLEYKGNESAILEQVDRIANIINTIHR